MFEKPIESIIAPHAKKENYSIPSHNVTPLTSTLTLTRSTVTESRGQTAPALRYAVHYIFKIFIRCLIGRGLAALEVRENDLAAYLTIPLGSPYLFKLRIGLEET